jgi:predicted methyltransferase
MCKRFKSLKPGGVICIKDNAYGHSEEEDDDHFCVDRGDSSVTRSSAYFEALFRFAGLTTLLCERQTKFPKEIYPVLMYALA